MLYLLFISKESFHVRKLIKFKIIPLSVIIACFFFGYCSEMSIQKFPCAHERLQPHSFIHWSIYCIRIFETEFHPIFTLTEKLEKALTCKSRWIVNGSSKLAKAFWKTCQIRSQKQCRMAKLWEPFKGSRHMVILMFWKTKTKQYFCWIDWHVLLHACPLGLVVETRNLISSCRPRLLSNNSQDVRDDQLDRKQQTRWN